MASVCKMYPERLPERVRREPKLWAEVQMYDALARCMGFGWVVFYDIAWLGRVKQFDAPRDGQSLPVLDGVATVDESGKKWGSRF